MKVLPTPLPEVLLLEPQLRGDQRGHFFESFNQAQMESALGRPVRFLQDNQSRSARGVVRGLHYQIRQPQGKLVRVLAGRIYDVAVDLRADSTHFGKCFGCELSAENNRQIWVPEGFAHGFMVLSDSADILYKVTNYWAPEHERCVQWNDPQLGIPWPEQTPVILSEKDARGVPFAAAEYYKPGMI